MLLFPHETVRPSQQEFIDAVGEAVRKGTNLIVHAPTGMGKTAGVLSPALSETLESDKTVFFLTSRHTQHEIAIKTLQAIKEKHGTPFSAIDIIGKKWMCLQGGVQRLPSVEFAEFCRAMREDGKCDYYSRLKKGEKLTVEGRLVVEALGAESPVRSQKIILYAQEHKVCPYYASMEIAKGSKVIIGDYYYVFHPRVREQFFTRSENELANAVIIVDEAHNLPARIKDLASSRLSSLVLKRAITEAKKHRLHEVVAVLEKVLDAFEEYAQKLRGEQREEMHLSREEFVTLVGKYGNYDELIGEMTEHADNIREESQVSFIGAVAGFLEDWQGADEGYTRILSRRKGLREEVITLSYRCLDPSVVAEPIVKEAHATILMSGTLTPTSMYAALLGMTGARELSFGSPFPKENRLNIVIPKTSTKYTTRGLEQYRHIAEVLVKTISAIPGNAAVFFPSYQLLQEVAKHFQTATEKTVFLEQQEMDTQEKQEFLDNFRRYKNVGAVLLGVITGNFGEGIDLPGDELKGVVIVGLPLQKPDLETQALIDYYEKKFGKGWDYGYLFPAFNKTMQSAGRCIRSETDRGVVVFLDERYAWPNYKRCFPADWDVKITLLYEKLIKDFFKKEKA